MSSRVVYRPLCWLVFGHEASVETNEAANKSEFVCVRCGAVLGDCVTNLRKPWVKPAEVVSRRDP
jgi:hypothetical protein